MPEGIYANEVILIKGAYLNPNLIKNKVFIEGNLAETISLNGSDLTVRVPVGPYPRRKAKVTIQVLDQITEYKDDIDILDDWVMVSNEVPFKFPLKNVVQANGDTYMVATNKNVNNNVDFSLLKFNANNFTWDQLSVPFTMNLNNAIVESNGDKIYIYLGNTTNDFWEYNPANSKWTQKSSFIGARRSGATHFAIGDKVYIGLGAVTINYQVTGGYQDFYKYSSSNDTWTRVSDLDLDLNAGDKRIFTTSFVINGLGYITGGGISPNDPRSWSYNPNLDQWIKIADNPFPGHGTASSVINGIGYVTGTNFGKEMATYIPINDSWEKSSELIKETMDHFTFTINNKIYIGGGTLGNEMFEYIP
jgi:N-acetylneuraminic acid mutarotase